MHFAGFSRRHVHQRGGYVLLMTLALLVIAALSATGMARRSLRWAMDASEAQSQLQRRWAESSCCQCVLLSAERHLQRLEATSGDQPRRWPAESQVGATVTLGGLAVELVLADEDAKLNLNALQARKSASVLPLLMGQRSSLAPSLRPDLSPAAQAARRTLAGWGQVYDVAAALNGPAGWKSLVDATSDLTCWGRNKPNIRRASDAVLETTATLAAGAPAARKLLAARRAADGELVLADLLATLDMRRADQLKLRGALSDTSSCASLWLALGDGRRQWYALWIAGDRAGRGPQKLQSFHF